MNKQKYFWFILVLLVLVFGLVLFSYYAQDFEATYNFADSVDDGDVVFDFYNRADGEFLNSVIIPIGSVELSNRGYFLEKYSSPRLAGCLLHTEDSVKRINDILWIGEYDGDIKYSGQSVGVIGANVAPGKNVSINIAASSRGFASQVYKSDMKDGTLKVLGMDIYELPKSERNPFFDNYEISQQFYSCDDIRGEYDPIAFIQYKWIWIN